MPSEFLLMAHYIVTTVSPTKNKASFLDMEANSKKQE